MDGYTTVAELPAGLNYNRVLLYTIRFYFILIEWGIVIFNRLLFVPALIA